MGTNYYLLTKDLKYKDKLGNKCEITDTPFFAYSLHLMKNSCGWLNLFEYHNGVIESVADIKRLYDTGDFEIYDEYNRKVEWADFEEIFTTKYTRYRNGETDKFESHIIAQKRDIHSFVSIRYFTDIEGYEFTDSAFS